MAWPHGLQLDGNQEAAVPYVQQHCCGSTYLYYTISQLLNTPDQHTRISERQRAYMY